MNRPTFALCSLCLGLSLTTSAKEVVVDADEQVGHNQTFRHVARITAQIPYNTVPDDAPENWAYDRYEGVIEEHLAWFRMSSNTTKAELFRVDEEGNYHFVPDPDTEAQIRATLKSGLRPMMQFATSTMPKEMAEGGYKPGHYGYNVRQPGDYDAWAFYIGSMFDYLIDTFGRDEVRMWSVRFGIESDWQAKAVYPGTDKEMNRKDNRREFMKLLDVFHGVAAEKLGPSIYIGNYFSFETQAPDYIDHWSKGTNFYTGEIGTRIAFCGFSDWSLLNFVEDYSPFTLEGKAERAKKPDAWAAMASIATGLTWKHDYIDEHANQYASMRGLETNLPEQGYFDTKANTRPDGVKKPADYMPADYRGATLYAMRTIAYTQTPRIAWSNTRFSLGPGDSANDYRDDVKTPVFNAHRLEKKLEGSRLLPVDYDPEGQDGNEVRVGASALDTETQQFQILAANFNNDFDAATPETVEIKLTDLPEGTTELLVDGTRIDADNNNWWAEWTQYREENGIDFVRGQSRTHLGSNFLWDEKYIKNTNHIRGTTDGPGYKTWLGLVPEYREKDDLVKTFTGERFAVKDGEAVLTYEIPANGTLFLEVTAKGSDSVERSFAAVEFGPGWEVDGEVAKVDEKAVRLVPNQDGVNLSRTFSNLEPNANYAVVVEAKSEVRMLDYGLDVSVADDESASPAWGDYTSFWNRLVMTGKTDPKGELTVSLTVPKQPVEDGDGVTYRNLTIRRL